ncbi:MAG: hypothetical protein MK089_11480 [Phycisphaerales bacterium]|nr:hypothetical protein [Phycisphaerae bacterium]MCH2153949.1 hypothetical protein [Phycisphaerales bacterium]
MERGPIMRVLAEIKGTSKSLRLSLQGRETPVEIEQVMEAVELHSANGIRITTAKNDIWLDASHVSAIWHTRDEG